MSFDGGDARSSSGGSNMTDAGSARQHCAAGDAPIVLLGAARAWVSGLSPAAEARFPAMMPVDQRGGVISTAIDGISTTAG